MKSLHVKIYITFMFISGLLQISIFELSWENFRLIQAVHILASAFLALLIIPFVNMHTYEYLIIKKRNSKSGILLGIVLFFIVLSGFYLFLVGNRGSDIYGIISFYIHLFGSFLLIYFLLLHIKKGYVRING